MLCVKRYLVLILIFLISGEFERFHVIVDHLGFLSWELCFHILCSCFYWIFVFVKLYVVELIVDINTFLIIFAGFFSL